MHFDGDDGGGGGGDTLFQNGRAGQGRAGQRARERRIGSLLLNTIARVEPRYSE